MIDLRDYDQAEIDKAASLLIRLWGSHDDVELGSVLDDLLQEIENLREYWHQRAEEAKVY